MSSKVDNRVVEMQFNNANFEKNASQSISTLDRLKKALNLDDAAKGFDKVEQSASKFDFSKLITAAETITSRFSTFGIIGDEAIRRVSNSVMDLTGKLTSFITSGIAQGGLNRAFNLENANFQLQGLLKDTAKVDEVMKDVSASVDGTAYSMDAAAKAASMLAASGIQASSAGGDMLTSLRAITGVAAMTSSDYEGIAQIFTTVAGQGRLMGDQLLQLSSRGMNAAATLATYLTKIGDGTQYTEKEIREMVSDGQISFKLFSDAMDDAFGEHAYKANETFSGSMANIKSALARIGADFVSPLIAQGGRMVEFFNAVRIRINDIRTMTKPLAIALANTFKTVFKQLSEQVRNVNLQPLADKFKSLKENVQEFNKNLDLSPLFTVMGNLGTTISNLARPITQAFGAIGAAFKDVFPESIIDTIVSVTEKFAKLTSGLFLNVPQVEAIRGVFQGLFTVLRTIGEILIGAVKTGFNAFTTYVAPAALKLLEFAGYIGHCIKLFHDWVDENNLVTKAIDLLKSTISGIAGKISSWIDEFKDIPAVKMIFEGFSQAFTGSLKSIKDLLGEAANKVGEFVNKVMETKSLKLDDVKEFLGSLGETAGKVFGALRDHFKTLRDNLSWIPESFSGMVEKVISILTPFKDKIVEIIGGVADFLTDNFDPGAFLAAGFGLAIFQLLKKIIEWSNIIPSAIGKVTSAISGFFKSLDGLMKSMAFEKKANGIYTIAKAIAVLAGSLIALSFIDPDRLISAGAALGSLAAGLTVIAVAIEKFGGGGLDTKKFDISGVAKSMIALSAAIYLMVRALKSIQGLDSDGILGDLGVLAALIAGLVIATNKLVPLESGMKKSSITMIAFAIAINSMVGALQKIAAMDFQEAYSALPLLAALVGLLDSMQLASRGVSAGAGMSVVLAVAGIMLALQAVKQIAEIDPGDMILGVTVIGLLGGVIDAMLVFAGLATRLGGGGISGNAGITMVGAAASLLILGHAVEQLGSLDEGTLQQGLLAVGILSAVMDAMIAFTGLAGANAAKAAVTLIAFSAACGILSGVIWVLGSMDEGKVKQGLTAVTALGLVMSGIIAVTHLAQEAKSTLIIITVAIGVMAGALAMLSFCDPTGVAVAAGAMSAVMAMFALIVASTAIAKSANATLAIVAIVVAALGGILVMLSGMAPENVLASAQALSLVMAALSASMLIISNCQQISASAVVALAAIGVVMAGIGALVSLMETWNLIPSLESVKSLSLLIVSMSAACILLEVAGLAASAAMAGIGVLMTLITSIAAFATVVGGLSTMYPELEEFLDRGLDILTRIGTGLGEFFGNIIGGFINSVGDSLVRLGTQLSMFMMNIQPFIMGANTIPDDLPDHIGKLTSAIVMLGAADMINSIMSFLGGGINYAELGRQLETFGLSMVKFSNITAGKIDASSVEAAAKAGELMATLQRALPREGGWLEWITGTKMDMGEFGRQIETFALSITRISNQFKSNAVDAAAIESVANAGLLMAELQNALPREGGKIQEFIGSKLDMGTFGLRIESFCKAMGKASNALKENPVDPDAVEGAANAGMLFSNLQNSLPETGGKLQAFFGETQSLTTFGQSIVDFCTAMGKASAALVENPIDEEAVTSAKNMGDLFSALENGLPKESGTVESWFFGSNQHLDDFGENIKTLGEGLKNFSDSVSGIDSSQTNVAIALIRSLASVEKDSLAGIDVFRLSTFGEQMSSFCTWFAGGVQSLQGISFTALQATIEGVNSLITMFQTMGSVGFDSVNSFIEALDTLGQTGVDNFCSAFDNANGRVFTTLSSFMLAAMNGMRSQQASFLTLTMLICTQQVTAINSYQPQFYSAGSSLMSQLIGGYTSKVPEFTTLVLNTMTGVYNTIVAFEGPYQEAGNKLMGELMAGYLSQESPLLNQLQGTMDQSLGKVTDRKPEFDAAGQALMTNLGAGIKAAETAVTTNGVVPVVNAACTAVQDERSNFYSAGDYLTQGLASGIRAGVNAAIEAARYVARAAHNATRSELQEHSPSKKGIEAGEDYSEGVAIGITNNGPMVEDAAEIMAQAAITATRVELQNGSEDIKDDLLSYDELLKQATVPASKDTGTEIGSALVDGVKDGVDGIDGTVSDSVGGELKKTDSEMSPEAKALGQKLMNALSEGLKEAKTPQELAFGQLLYNKVNEVFQGEQLGTTGSTIGDKVVEGATSEIDKSGADKIADSIVDAGEKATTKASPAFNNLGRTLLKTLADGIAMASTAEEAKFGQKLYDAVQQKFLDEGGTLSDVGSDTGNKVTEGTTDSIDKSTGDITGSITNTVTDAGDKSKPIANEVGNEIGKEIGDGITEGMGKQEAINGNYITVDGEDIKKDTNKLGIEAIDTFIEGLGERTKGVKESLEGLVNTAMESMKSMTDKFGTAGTECTDAFIESFDKALGKIDLGQLNGDTLSAAIGETLANAITEAVGNIDKTLSESFKTTGNEIGTMISEGIGSQNDTARAAVEGILNTVKSRINDSLEEFKTVGGWIANAIAAGIQTDITVGVGGMALDGTEYKDKGKENADQYSEGVAEGMDRNGEDISNNISAPVEDGVEDVKTNVSKGMAFTISTLTSYSENFRIAGESLISNFSTSFLGGMDDMKKDMDDKLEAIKISITKNSDTFSELGKSATAGFMEGLTAPVTENETLSVALQHALEDIDKTIDAKAMGRTMMKLLQDGINEGATDSVNTMTTVVKNMMDSLDGIDEPMKNAGVALASGIVEGMNSKIPDVNTAALEIANTVIIYFVSLHETWFAMGSIVGSKYASGMKTRVQEVSGAARSLGEAAQGALRQINGYSAGFSLGSSYAAGIRSSIESVRLAASELRAAGESSLNSAMNDLINTANSIGNVSPVITPELDRSEFDKEYNEMMNLLNGPTSTSIKSAADISNALSNNGNQNVAIGEPQQAANVNYNFEQNNYSPKALSRTEIYRQTKNQFSMLKGVGVSV